MCFKLDSDCECGLGVVDCMFRCGPHTPSNRRGGSRFRELLSQVTGSPAQPLALPATRGALLPSVPLAALRSAEREMQQEEDLAPRTGTRPPVPDVVAIAASEALEDSLLHLIRVRVN